MNTVRSSCPRCGSLLEIPSDLETIICSSCGGLYAIRRLEGSIGLTAVSGGTTSAGQGTKVDNLDGEIGRFMAVTQRLALVEEDIESVSSDIELIRSKEQGAPLQFGCALFGVFVLVVMALGFFATVGKGLFGGWLFYLSILAIVLVSLKGLQKKLMSPAERRALLTRRARLEGILEQLCNERERLTALVRDRPGQDQSPPHEPGAVGPAS